jgi:hypothetical protein
MRIPIEKAAHTLLWINSSKFVGLLCFHYRYGRSLRISSFKISFFGCTLRLGALTLRSRFNVADDTTYLFVCTLFLMKIDKASILLGLSFEPFVAFVHFVNDTFLNNVYKHVGRLR